MSARIVPQLHAWLQCATQVWYAPRVSRPASSRPLGAVVLAAGQGTRMRSGRAKVLHELAGRPLVRWPLAALAPLRPERVAVVVGHQADAVRLAVLGSGLGDVRIAVQTEQRGTGHAVACAAAVFAGFVGDVLLVYGDVPRVRTATLEALLAAHAAARADLTLVTMHFADPRGYGRIVRDAGGRVLGIVEERDATAEQRAISEVNPGLYAVRAEVLFPLLAELRPTNAQGELYLTDLVGLAAGRGLRVATVQAGTPDEVAGINTRAELAHMERVVRDDAVGRWMAAGVTFEDPATAYVGPDVTIGADTVIGPNVQLRGRTRIGAGCRLDGTAYLADTTLGARVHLLFGVVADGAEVAADVRIGPFARLRPGTRLGERVHVGNFVETKNAVLGAGTKANHLTYLGDCEVGGDTNVGAGTITCNYDGFRKHRTTIGARVQIGSDTQLVAPVSVGDDAYVGAGTTVTRDVPPGALVVSRVPQRVVPGWTARKRARATGAPPPAPKRVRPAPAAKPARSRKRKPAAARVRARRRR
jgi:bifunctional UDP-N-acetylglucosamine pyrophosphorylase/glucosamine-1-phosphate N-acetyltransferase